MSVLLFVSSSATLKAYLWPQHCTTMLKFNDDDLGSFYCNTDLNYRFFRSWAF